MDGRCCADGHRLDSNEGGRRTRKRFKFGRVEGKIAMHRWMLALQMQTVCPDQARRCTQMRNSTAPGRPEQRRRAGQMSSRSACSCDSGLAKLQAKTNGSRSSLPPLSPISVRSFDGNGTG
ncbi:hypothetical protein LIA77_09960 [Sarocladium implicatum]|nr:hypothetical protein LIA77_09960 [Sarocladium implicatum]